MYEVDTQPKRILIEPEGVIVNLALGALCEWRVKYPNYPFFQLDQQELPSVLDNIPEKYRGLMARICNEEGFIRKLPPVYGALQALREMREMGHIVRIVDFPSPDHRNGVVERSEWVEKHLGAQWKEYVVSQEDTFECRGDVLITARPDTKPDLGSELVIFDRPYNHYRTDVPRLAKWENWRQVIGSLSLSPQSRPTL